MKKILVTGANSYIGTSFEKWLQQWCDKYNVDTLNMRDGSWKNKDFSQYDSVLHVAGIAHIKETKENADLYYKVNRDMVYEVAQKAKTDGVKQFIFLSSMSVYGIESGVIDKDSPLNPKNNYGKSKLQAEKLIVALEDDTYKIVILRPPMIYGKGCKGNYKRLAKFALKLPVFPDMWNQRSMIYIDNLCEFIRLLIDDCKSGLFCPQNKDYVCTTEMVILIAGAHGKRVRLTKLFNPLLKLIKSDLINKVFGDLVYKKSMSEYQTYCIADLRTSIYLTERDLNCE
jgi:UDP-glucose 4-epimerase